MAVTCGSTKDAIHTATCTWSPALQKACVSLGESLSFGVRWEAGASGAAAGGRLSGEVPLGFPWLPVSVGFKPQRQAHSDAPPTAWLSAPGDFLKPRSPSPFVGTRGEERAGTQRAPGP